MKESCSVLPEGYREILSVDLKNNKKLALLVNLISVFIGIACFVIGHLFVSIGALFDMEAGLGQYFLRFGALLGLMLAYIVLHELVHGVAMKLCGTKKVKYGFTGVYAFAGSEDYYSKGAYIFIALAPVVFWGIVVAVITPFLSDAWFWPVYFVQVINLSGAAGDFYVTWKFMRLPKNIWVHDSGVSMTVYSAEESVQ